MSQELSATFVYAADQRAIAGCRRKDRKLFRLANPSLSEIERRWRERTISGSCLPTVQSHGNQFYTRCNALTAVATIVQLSSICE